MWLGVLFLIWVIWGTTVYTFQSSAFTPTTRSYAPLVVLTGTILQYLLCPLTFTCTSCRKQSIITVCANCFQGLGHSRVHDCRLSVSSQLPFFLSFERVKQMMDVALITRTTANVVMYVPKYSKVLKIGRFFLFLTLHHHYIMYCSLHHEHRTVNMPEEQDKGICHILTHTNKAIPWT